MVSVITTQLCCYSKSSQSQYLNYRECFCANKTLFTKQSVGQFGPRTIVCQALIQINFKVPSIFVNLSNKKDLKKNRSSNEKDLGGYCSVKLRYRRGHSWSSGFKLEKWAWKEGPEKKSNLGRKTVNLVSDISNPKHRDRHWVTKLDIMELEAFHGDA